MNNRITTKSIAVLMLFAALGTSDDTVSPDTEVIVKLKGMVAEGETRLGYSRPRVIRTERTVPRFLFEVPKFQSKEPLFFRIALGQTEGEPFYAALDRSPAGLYYDRLYIDKDRDLDLTNDGEPFKARIRTIWTTNEKLIEFLDLKLELPYRVEGKVSKQAYPCVVFFTLKPGETLPKRVAIERDGWRAGSTKIQGAEYSLVVVDDDSDGQFSTSDSWALLPANTAPAKMLGPDATRTMLFPSWSTDQKWTVEVKAVASGGASVTLLVKRSRETERQYFTRVATAQQTAEERQLKIDPLRPKIGSRQKVDWITRKDAGYALKIAQSPNVQKPVLLAFDQKTCRWCAMMYKHTFTDREVYQLMKRFVPARIPFKKSGDDSKKYKAQGTPTYVVLSVEGAEIARHVGFMRPTAFAAWLKSALR